MKAIPFLLLALAAGILWPQGTSAQFPLPATTIARAVLERSVKGTSRLQLDGIAQAYPKLKRLFGNQPTVVQAEVVQTFHRIERTRHYPHQPRVSEIVTFRELTSGAHFSRRVWTNGMLSLNETVVVTRADPTRVPDWAPAIALNHMKRDCGIEFGGEYLDDATDQTYELVVRCRAVNWPRNGVGARAYVDLIIPHLRVQFPCLDPEFRIDVGAPGKPDLRSNGLDIQLEHIDVPVVLDISGAGSSATIRPPGKPDLVESNGRGPRITRMSAIPSTTPPIGGGR